MYGSIKLCLVRRDDRWKTNKIQKSLKCKLNNIFECLNEWTVANLITSKNDEVHDDELAKEILHGVESKMSEKIVKGNCGAMRTDDPATDWYYIVKWISNVCIYQEDIVIKWFNLPEFAYVGGMVCQARF